MNKRISLSESIIERLKNYARKNIPNRAIGSIGEKGAPNWNMLTVEMVIDDLLKKQGF